MAPTTSSALTLPPCLAPSTRRINESDARNILGLCFDAADWETMCGTEGDVDKRVFLSTIEIRNSTPTLRAWLEHWRIDELTQLLEDNDVMTPGDLCLLDTRTIDNLNLKVVQKKVRRRQPLLRSLSPPSLPPFRLRPPSLHLAVHGPHPFHCPPALRQGARPLATPREHPT